MTWQNLLQFTDFTRVKLRRLAPGQWEYTYTTPHHLGRLVVTLVLCVVGLVYYLTQPQFRANPPIGNIAILFIFVSGLPLAIPYKHTVTFDIASDQIARVAHFLFFKYRKANTFEDVASIQFNRHVSLPGYQFATINLDLVNGKSIYFLPLEALKYEQFLKEIELEFQKKNCNKTLPFLVFGLDSPDP